MRLNPADEVVLRVAEEMAARVEELTAQLRERTTDEVEAFRDPLMLDLLSASIRSNLETFVQIIRFGLPLPEHTSPLAAAEYARRLAQRGADPAALLRSYRLGQESAVLWSLDRITELTADPAIAQQATRRLVELSFRYVDAVSVQIMGEYESERHRWVANASSVRQATIDELLSGRPADVSRAEAALDYRLRQHHVAVVLWLEHEGSPEQTRGLEHVLTRLAREYGGAGQPLFQLQDRSSAWGWLPLGRHTRTVEALSPDLVAELNGLGARAAVGSALPGPEGFRDSHLEALKAQALALTARSPRTVTLWSDPDVRTAALLMRDVEGTRRMVRSELGDLGADGDVAAALRETLRVFLDEQGSYASAAARLNVHKNTVRYRIEKATEARGRPLDEGRLELELALIAYEWLGPVG